jgi:hypothetical protein
MALLVGQPIDARELEQTTSQWSPDRFASMCNNLVWAISGRQYPKLPSFTERVNSADGGIDAEWQVEISDGAHALPTPIVGPGWNVFQYKKRDLIAQDRRRIISHMKSSLKKAMVGLTRELAKTPSRYVLFLNVDLKHDQTLALKDAILEGYSRRSEIQVEVIGAAEIAAFLNNQPHLRAAYFAPLSFKTWEEANRSHRTQKLFGFDVGLVGREDAVTQLRSLVDNSQVHVVVVTGPHDIGKSRLVLEATSHRPQDIIFALDPRSMQLDDYRKLVSEQRDVVCAVEDPDPDRVQALVNETLGIERLKLIITFPTAGEAPSASYGSDERIQSLSLVRLNDEDSRKLLIATGKRLDFGVESWILDRAGGNPGILLAAASIGEKLRDEQADFETAVGREFAKRIESELGVDALKCAELLSPLTHVGISGQFELELKLICQIFRSDGWQPATVLSWLNGLEKAGLAKRGGSFAEITIPFLANHLLAELLRGRKNEVFALFVGLDQRGRQRLLNRLSQVRSEEVRVFWDAMFDPNDPKAPFGNFNSALRQEHILRLSAGAVPERTIEILESGLIGTSRQERLVISDEPRRELVWALEQLLFRAQTSRRALKLIWLLAEAENEKWGNNATGVLSECFHPLHSQMPLLLHERLDALREFTSGQASKQGKLVAIRAAGKALSSRVNSLRHSTGAVLLDRRPVFTYRDLYDYARALIDHLFSLVESEEDEIAQAALEQLPTLVSELATQGQPNDALERLNKLVEWALSEKPGVSVAALYRAVEFVRRTFGSFIAKQEIAANRRAEFQLHIEQLDQLIVKLERGSFPVRLKRWASGWHSKDQEEVTIDGKRTYKFDHALENLAKEVVSNPALLTPHVASWLVSGKAQRSNQFFFHVGRLDANGQLRSEIEEIGAENSGGIAFGTYWRGQAEVDRKKAEVRLEELATSGSIACEAFLAAVAHLGPSQSTLRLIRDEILSGWVSPKAVSEFLYGEWIRGISTDELLSLLKTLAGNQLENASVAINVLGRWADEGRSLEAGLGEFAWQCLEAVPPIRGNEVYDFDKVASKLAEVNLERGFNLLEKLLVQPEDRRAWCPIDRYAGESNFWNVLHAFDRRRALRTVFAVALRDPLYSFRVTWNLEELLNQKTDADILAEFALETESQAILVAESITNAKEGFWAIAFAIIENYPANQKVWNALMRGVEQIGRVIEGPYSRHIESCRKEVEKKLGDPATPTAARPWLRDIIGRLEGEVGRHVIWEYDEDVNDLRRYIDLKDKNAPERLWAIARVLKYADWKDAKRMLTVEDIEEALPQIDLPEKKRKALEKALEVWRSGS